MKQHYSVILIGHVDSGKTTIAGQILSKWGKIDQRILMKLKNEHPNDWMTYITSEQDEQERGITIDIAREYFETQNRRFTLIDAPGHKNLIPNMITGAILADIALLVVSSRLGEYEAGFERGGQTMEHVILCRALGVKQIIVLINKMDVDNWDETRFITIKNCLNKFIKNTGYSSKRITYIPVSGLTGQHLYDMIDPNMWYKGSTLYDTLDNTNLKIPSDSSEKTRFPVLYTEVEKGYTKCFGKLQCGKLSIHDDVVVLPQGITTRINDIQIEHDLKQTDINRGELAVITLNTQESITTGSVLASISNKCYTTMRFIVLMEVIDSTFVLSKGFTSMIHIHAESAQCEIEHILEVVNKKGQVLRKNPTMLQGMNMCKCVLRVNKVVCIEKYEDVPELCRFVLRKNDRTFAVGKVVKLSIHK